MYGELRLIYENLIDSAADITLSSQATGFISGVKKTGSGVATMAATGPYAGTADLMYTIVCDSIAGGTDVGQATFKWRTSATAASTWEQTGVLTATTPLIALSSDGLGTDIELSFVGNVGTDFAVDDTWTFETCATYGAGKMLDRDRNTCIKTTGDTAETIVVNSGAAENVTAVLLHDHNISDAATVTFQANATDSWGSPSYENVFSAITDPLYLYLDQTYQYKRWLIEDPTNPDGYIKVSNIMHSVYAAFDQCNAVWGSSETPGLKMQGNESEPGILRRYLYAYQKDLSLIFGELFSNDDIDTLIEIQEGLANLLTKRIMPLWVHEYFDQPETLRLMNWHNIDQWQRVFRSYLLNSGTTMLLSEAVKV